MQDYCNVELSRTFWDKFEHRKSSEDFFTIKLYEPIKCMTWITIVRYIKQMYDQVDNG